MIWGYPFAAIEAYLNSLGFKRRFETDLTVVFANAQRDIFTIRRPNVAGWLPENRVMDAFDNAGIEPPGQATDFGD